MEDIAFQALFIVFVAIGACMIAKYEIKRRDNAANRRDKN